MEGSLCPTMRMLIEKTSDVKVCITYMREIGLLHENFTCNKCDRSMKLAVKPAHTTKDQEVWFCSKCKSTRSIRQDSIFKVCQWKLYIFYYHQES